MKSTIMKKSFFILTALVFAVVVKAQMIENVPYFYQYNNSVDPGGSCQNTCMAMILKYYGADGVTPDLLNNKWGTAYAQSVSGFQSL